LKQNERVSEGTRRSPRLAEKQKQSEYAKSHVENVPLVVTRTGRIVKAPDRYSDAFEQIRVQGLKEKRAMSKDQSMGMPPSALDEDTRQSVAELLQQANDALAKSQVTKKAKTEKPAKSKVTKADVAAADEALKNLTAECEKDSPVRSDERSKQSQRQGNARPDPDWFLDFE